MLHDMRQRATKHHSLSVPCVVQKIYLIMCHDKVFKILGTYIINKNREKPKRICQGIPRFRRYILHDLIQRSPKQHMSVLPHIWQKNDLLWCHDENF